MNSKITEAAQQALDDVCSEVMEEYRQHKRYLAYMFFYACDSCLK